MEKPWQQIHDLQLRPGEELRLDPQSLPSPPPPPPPPPQIRRRSHGVSEEEGDARALVALLKDCAHSKDLKRGRVLHSEIAHHAALRHNVYLGSALVNLYAKCGDLGRAREVLEELPERNAVAWNALISGYAQRGYGEEALDCFRSMRCEGILPRAVSFVCALKACAAADAREQGQAIHAEIVERDLLQGSVPMSTTLVDMYAKCGDLASAERVFEGLRFRDVATWNALISGYVQQGRNEEALDRYRKMRCGGIGPDPITFVCVLKACGRIGDVEKGRELHEEIKGRGLIGENAMVGNALVDMYARCGEFAEAREVLDGLPFRDSIAWNSMLASYASQGRDEEALACFERMQGIRCPCIRPDAVTYISILKACGHVGAACRGLNLHDEMIREGLLGHNNFLLSTALLEMYARCGAAAEAQDVFEGHAVKDVVTWNALLAGYAQLGEHGTVFRLVERMVKEGVLPDAATFTVVLSACSHSGLLKKGRSCFEGMKRSYGIVPSLEHHTCMVGLFGRAGHFDGAEIALIDAIPFSADLVLWHTVLSACKKWGNVGLARLAFRCAMQLDLGSAASYVYMGDIYAGEAGGEDD